MKKLLSILILTISTLCVTSCGIMNNNINAEQTNLNVEIFQTLSKTSALAHTSLWSDYKVVKIVTTKDVYYDGKQISGLFVLVDTYTYETKDGRIKTVPVYQRKSELR